MRNNSKTDKVRRGQRTKNSTNSAFIGDGCLVGAAGLRHDQHLLLPCCCCVRERFGLFFLMFCIAPRLRGVRLFSCFFVSPRGAKAPKSFFRKRPGIVVNAPGRLFSYSFTCKILPPRGAFTRNNTVQLVLRYFEVINSTRPSLRTRLSSR